MAYTYLDITNEVLARFNEVALTAANFGSSRGFQTQCKNAVNDAINYIFQREFGWSFSHSEQTETLVANTTRYTIGASIYNVDYETFRISKDDSLGVAGVTAFADVDVPPFQLQRRVRLERGYGPGGDPFEEQRKDLHHAAEADGDQDERHQQPDVLFYVVVIHDAPPPTPGAPTKPAPRNSSRSSLTDPISG